MSQTTTRGHAATHTNRVAWLAFSNDGETLATADDDGLKLWNVNTRRLIFTLKEKKAARIAFSPVGTLLAISYGGAHSCRPAWWPNKIVGHTFGPPVATSKLHVAGPVPGRHRFTNG